MQKGFRQSLEALYLRRQRESNAHASYGYVQLLMSLIRRGVRYSSVRNYHSYSPNCRTILWNPIAIGQGCVMNNGAL